MFSSPSGRVSVMQVLVLAAIMLVLLAFGIPIYSLIKQGKHRSDALARLQKLGSATRTYANLNDGRLPNEDAAGKDTWDAAADPASANAWYNALLKIVGQKSVAEYASSPGEFYTPGNLLYFPGAQYSEKKMVKPQFAVGFNTKLHRKDPEGRDVLAKMSEITIPSRTVLFLERGLPGEERAMPQQSKKDYDGTSKASAKAFVARYGGKGLLLFVDGRADLYKAEDLLTETGRFPFPVTGTDVIWGRTAEEDPNKP